MAEMTFEKALEKLETIVNDMDSEDVSLDASLKKFEEGIKMVRFCKEKLEKAEKKIEILMKDAEGKTKKKPFNPQAASSDISNQKSNDVEHKQTALEDYENELPF
ncbi:MAG: exodeoxyribonuclease VII small subunit [Candidatus Theseobacter exili]|nr:exodeoxyribonuclease VII small subunit [Candidatus Theseobacter exili]